ncbi:hypothetical protein P835_01372 [Citrobacter portucalensis]|uniref:AbiV family abortive infection protein n=1 Tax=Citrobacter portucalensis TaxID=1639133 RepID=UPI00044DF488|nr:AbiV family abortive infection protein [Citrobacter portucalensis]EFD0690951.1 AbiV family abortive infection protein [Escherichia coli]EIZ7722763.1 AbiV family abortive infection protein [Escherichia coli]ETX64185.1 hypothetical protein P835_01372 [Citrobacter portucalensis]
MADKHSDLAWDLIFDATDNGSPLFNTQDTKNDFNKACDHIQVLVEDAFSCYTRGSYGTSVFLSITAIEETAKAEIGLYRRNNKDIKKKKRKDPLFDHLTKHRMAILPTVFMGRRLVDVIGEARCQALRKEVASGSLKELREKALYFYNSNGRLLSPKDVITRNKAKEIILLAIETIDDRLVGYTGHTGIIEMRLNQIFADVSSS